MLLLVLLCCSCSDDSENMSSSKSITISDKILNIQKEKTVKDVLFFSDTDWMVISEASWLNVSPSSGVAGKGLSLSLTIENNDSYTSRIGNIIIKESQGITSDTLIVKQAGRSNYVPIDWKTTTISSLDLTQGNIVLDFKDKIPDFNNESIIVILTDTVSFIRKVLSVSNITKAHEGRITLHTVSGNMSDLFIDKEFVLSTQPQNESSSNGVVYPDRILKKEKNSYVTIYDSSHPSIGLYSCESEFSDLIKWNKTYSSLKSLISWGIGLNITLKFKFGNKLDKREGIEVVKIGDLEAFSITFNGKVAANFDVNMLASKADDSKIKEPVMLVENNLNYIYQFSIPGQNIPLSISVNSDLLANASFFPTGALEFNGRAGVGLNDLNIGMEYVKDNDYLIPSFDAFQYCDLTNPKYTGESSVNIRTKVYSSIYVKIYDQIGPSIKPTLYFNNKLKGGAINKLYTQVDSLYTGLDMNFNLNMKFAGIDWNNSYSKDKTVENLLYSSPQKIKLVPIESENEVQVNKKVSLRFQVFDSNFMSVETPKNGALVQFVSKNGKIDNEWVLSDKDGYVEVKWTPKSANAGLIARLLAPNGEEIDRASFDPCINMDLFGTWNIPIGDNVVENASRIMTLKDDYTYILLYNQEKKHFIYTSDKEQTDKLLVGTESGKYTFVPVDSNKFPEFNLNENDQVYRLELIPEHSEEEVTLVVTWYETGDIERYNYTMIDEYISHGSLLDHIIFDSSTQFHSIGNRGGKSIYTKIN